MRLHSLTRMEFALARRCYPDNCAGSFDATGAGLAGVAASGLRCRHQQVMQSSIEITNTTSIAAYHVVIGG